MSNTITLKVLMPNKKVSTDLFITQILMNRRQCQVQVCQSAKSRDYLTLRRIEVDQILSSWA